MPAERSFRLPPWTAWLLVAGLVPVALVGWMAFQVAQYRQQAWPLLQQVVHRLERPEQAQALWEHNPALHDAYPDARAFQAELDAWMPRFGALPETEPEPSRRSYFLHSEPGELRISLQGRGGAWMRLVVQGPGPLGLGEVPGEGVTSLVFAEQEAGLTVRQHEVSLLKHKALWDRYRRVESSLRTETAARQLWVAEPRLQRTFKRQEDFLRATEPWRHTPPDLPEDIAGAQERMSLRIQDSPMGHTESAGYPGPEGTMLWVTWRDGSLDTLDPTVVAHGH